MKLIGLIDTDFYQRIKRDWTEIRSPGWHSGMSAILWIPAKAVTNDSRTGNSVISAGSVWNKFISNTMYNSRTQNTQNSRNFYLSAPKITTTEQV